MEELATFGGEVTLAQKPETLPEGQKVTPEQEYRLRLALDQKRILQTLPIAKINLTSNEKSAAELYHQAYVLLGPVAAAPMVMIMNRRRSMTRNRSTPIGSVASA